MKFKEKWKRFWTLSRASEGFTLVELIVVIAILAILSGVAVPAYSGYIKKAEKAGDLQLLGAVNTAFAAAVMDRDQKSAAELANGSISFNVDSMEPSDYKTEFGTYFAGNTGKFKVIKSLVLQGGVFVDPSSVSAVTLTYGGKTITISGEKLAAVAGSTYGSIGGEALLGEVSSLVDLVGGEDMDVTDLLGDEDYLRSFASYIGIEGAADLSGKALTDAIDAATADWDEEASGNAMINGLVYYAAENSTTMTVEGVTSLLTADNIRDELSDDKATMLAQASMVYGAYTGYVNSEYYKGSADAVESDPIKIVKTLGGDANFDAYVKSQQGQDDLAAYIAAMGVINESTGNEATADVLKNGFSDPELVTLMQGVLGK